MTTLFLSVLLVADLTTSQARHIRIIANEIRQRNTIVVQLKQLEEECNKWSVKRFRPSYNSYLHNLSCQRAEELRNYIDYEMKR